MSEDRGFQGVLHASCIVTCPVPFKTRHFEFDEGDLRVRYQIVDGEGRRKIIGGRKNKEDKDAKKSDDEENGKNNSDHDENEQNEEEKNELDKVKNEEEDESDKKSESESQSNEEEEDEEVPDFDYEFEVNDRTIEGDRDSGFSEDIMTICEHLRNNIAILYDATVLKIHLSFGAKTDGHEIWLVDGDVTTNVNSFSRSLFAGIPNGEIEFTNFLIEQFNDYPDKNDKECYSGFKSCGKANYKVPRILVIFSRARQKFPTVNEVRLYKMVKTRVAAFDDSILDQTVNVCISCVHYYTAEEKTLQAQKDASKQSQPAEAPPFSALTPAELSEKGLKDVGLHPDQCKPFCYTINVRDSPYKDPVPKARKPDDPPPRPPIQPIPKSEKWVDRMLDPYNTQSPKGSAEKSRNDSPKSGRGESGTGRSSQMSNRSGRESDNKSNKDVNEENEGDRQSQKSSRSDKESDKKSQKSSRSNKEHDQEEDTKDSESDDQSEKSNDHDPDHEEREINNECGHETNKESSKTSQKYTKGTARSNKSSPKAQRESYRAHKTDDLKLPEFPPTHQYFSEKLAYKAYNGSPFNYKFIEKNRKKNETMIRKSQQSSRTWRNQYQ